MNGAQHLVRDYADAMGIAEPARDVSLPESDGSGYLSAVLPVLDLATGAVAALTAARNRFAVATGLPVQRFTVAPQRVAAAFASDRLIRIDGAPVSGFAELSGFFRTADGWVRTHANYPHHRSRLLTALTLPSDADRADVERRLATLSALTVEDFAVASGAIAAQVRDENSWGATEQGRAAASGPLVRRTLREDRRTPSRTGPVPGRSPQRLLAGVRVLDLTRVIAGPVATRTLALLGAAVLRVDPPALPEIGWQHRDTGQGKQSTLLDLRLESGRTRFRELVCQADVLVTGYRPGSLERFGLDPAALSPGLVRARVDAWGALGPWSGRRGFDSIVQAASGISLIEGSGTPAALPAQALDHASGYLLAAAVVDALATQWTGEGPAAGRGIDVSVSLAGTASWLLGAPGRIAAPAPPTPPGKDTMVRHGDIVTARPALAEYDDYPWPARPWGADPPTW